MASDLLIWGRLVKWRMEDRSKNRYRAFRDELGYWIIASRRETIFAHTDLGTAKEKARQIVEAQS